MNLGSIAQTASRMVRPKFIDRGASIICIRSTDADQIEAHKDQLLYGLFCVLNLLAEQADPSIDWTVNTLRGESDLLVEVSAHTPESNLEQACSILRRFVDKGGDSGDIRLSLAREAITINGGELGFELRENQPIVYIRFSNPGDVS